MTDDKPIRQDARSQATHDDIDPELKAQVEHRERRRRKAQRKERPRQTYDLPQEVIDAIAEISEEEKVSLSDLAAWALSEFVMQYRAGEINLEPHKEFSRSLRYVWTLELPKRLSLE